MSDDDSLQHGTFQLNYANGVVLFTFTLFEKNVASRMKRFCVKKKFACAGYGLPDANHLARYKNGGKWEEMSLMIITIIFDRGC